MVKEMLKDGKTLFPSHYNYFVDRKDGTMCFNARTGSFLLMETTAARRLADGSLEEKEVDINTLIEGGFLHFGDELDEIKKLYFAQREEDDTLGITIVPSLECNRECFYCYQSAYKTERTMTMEVQLKTLEFITKKLEENFKKLSCTWYGGEPLLSKDVIFSMSSEIQRIAARMGVSILPMRMVTNGVLLSKDVVRQLANVGFNFVQVSIDNLLDDGRTTRGLITSDGKPSIILRNMIDATAELKVQIRVNVRKGIQAQVSRITEILREHGLEQNAYFARVSDFEGEAGATVDQDGRRTVSSGNRKRALEGNDALSRKAYAEFEKQALEGAPNVISVVGKKLTPKKTFCKATSGTMYVIDPDGYISRCWLSAGSKSEALGNVLTYGAEDDRDTVSQRWAGMAPFRYSECSSCKVLPLCMGGCSHPRVFMEAIKPPCEAIKHQIQFCVDVLGSKLSI